MARSAAQTNQQQGVRIMGAQDVALTHLYYKAFMHGCSCMAARDRVCLLVFRLTRRPRRHRVGHPDRGAAQVHCPDLASQPNRMDTGKQGTPAPGSRALL